MMERPAGWKLLKEYHRFNGHRNVCPRGPTNQCAIRMSVALGHSNCNFDFSQWTHGGVHTRGCGDIPPHVVNASNLAHYLRRMGLHFEIYRKSNTLSAEDIKQRVSGRMGIIFFSRCFPDGHRIGSHIDFWKGSTSMNEVLEFSPGAGLPASSDLFASSEREIWFSPTP